MSFTVYPNTAPTLNVELFSGSTLPGLTLFPPAVAAWSPADLSNITQWFKATTLALSDNDPVSTWVDSINGNDATGAGAARPTYKANAGDPYVEFDGTNDSLTFTRSAALNDLTVVVVLDMLTSVDYDRVFQLGSTNLAAMWAFPTINRFDGYLGATVVEGPSDTPAGFFVATLSRVTTTGVVRINGVDSAGFAVGSGAINTTSALGSNTAGGENCHERLKEVIICSGAITGGDFTSLATYILDTYGLTL
jgi:hypothetical protein